MTGILPVNRLYFTNVAPSFSPTVKGPWDEGGSGTSRKLGRIPEGASASASVSEQLSVDHSRWNAIFTSQPLAAPLTISGTVSWCAAVQENSALANVVTRIYLYVSIGSTNSVRGTLLDTFGGLEWPTTAAGLARTGLAITSVAAQTGDRIICEFGALFTNTDAQLFTATQWYGSTGNVDLTDGNTNVTTRPSWINFNSVALPVGS
jgi:hypothetical protein